MIYSGHVRGRIVNATRDAIQESRDPSQELFQICPEGSATTPLSSGTNSASTPTRTGNQFSDSDPSSTNGKGMSAGAIAGIAVAIAIIVATIIAATVTLYRIHKFKHGAATTAPKSTDTESYTSRALPAGPPEPYFSDGNIVQHNPYQAQIGAGLFITARPEKSALPTRIVNPSLTERSTFSSPPASSTSGDESMVTSSGDHSKDVDDGPVSHPDYLHRTISGRLPPAYGDLPRWR